MKTMKILITLLVILALSTSFVYAEKVYKGENLYDGYDHKVWVDEKTGEVTIIGYPTPEEVYRIERQRERNKQEYEQIIRDRYEAHQRNADRDVRRIEAQRGE